MQSQWGNTGNGRVGAAMRACGPTCTGKLWVGRLFGGGEAA
ncbi:hypothetical protein [Paenibacillus qinlingensis]|nr:hypothetical protein [Paenibacillus qinlingensis]